MQIPLSTSSATQPRICVTEKWKSFRSRFVELENPENALNEANLERETRANQYLNVECRPGFPRGFSPNELKFSIEMRIVGIPSSTRWNRLQDNEDGSCVPRFRRQFLFLLFFLHFFSCVYWNFLTIPSGTTIFLLFFNEENSFQQCQTGRFPRITIIIVALTSELLLLRKADLEFSIRVPPDSYELYLFRYTSWAKLKNHKRSYSSLSVSFAAGRMCNHVDWPVPGNYRIRLWSRLQYFDVETHVPLCFPKIGWNLIKFASLQSCLYGSWIDWNLHFKGYAMLHHFNQVPSGGCFRNIRLHSLNIREWAKHY